MVLPYPNSPYKCWGWSNLLFLLLNPSSMVLSLSICLLYISLFLSFCSSLTVSAFLLLPPSLTYMNMYYLSYSKKTNERLSLPHLISSAVGLLRQLPILLNQENMVLHQLQWCRCSAAAGRCSAGAGQAVT